ncbi:NADH dehydrogenase [ubiquinone] 1 beta subcomplex subunit 7 isoform X1 [Talpa occidentalis]|uniref:NADH dehydrogenase [ubiquinone] 1 beta subcomplex subunit 7 isoform X1 n=1 Tax=Talpa occidentalis TaxID=50954 RepID=UPI0023F6D1EC|nr:NADH dehydrogenase [ubiquinone] 1 beta subcomplex subunit 7 isoform X1 [Talpa occidentalis]
MSRSWPDRDQGEGRASASKQRRDTVTLALSKGHAGCWMEMVATQQEMNDAQLVLQQRDYCAHYLIRLLKCKRDSFPNFLACKHEQHDWDYCEHLDYVKRMKEFERERRLLQRKQRREQREANLARGQGTGEVAPEVAL